MRKQWKTGVLMAGMILATGWAGVAPAHAAAASTAASVPATCNGIPVTIFGTDGNDTITGTAGSDVIATGDGADTVFGLGAQDTACLGQGNDRFVGGQGSDGFVAESVPDGKDVFEGDGSDSVSYAARSTAVNVSLDGVANDGQVGEGDNVGLDASIITGGSGPDVLTAPLTAPLASVHGGPGNDRLSAGRFLFGEAGDDTLTHVGKLRAEMEGGDGRDRMVDQGTGGAAMDGGAGNDVLIAGGGPFGAFMTGRSGNDTMTGGPNQDFIFGIDGIGGNDVIIGNGSNGGNDNCLFDAGPPPDAVRC